MALKDDIAHAKETLLKTKSPGTWYKDHLGAPGFWTDGFGELDAIVTKYGVPAPPPPPPPPSGALLYKGDFGPISSITPTWDHVSDPDTSSPHPPKIIKDPTGTFTDNVLALTVDPSDGYVTGSGTGSSRVDVYKNAISEYAKEGLESFTLWEVCFPKNKAGGLPIFRPTNGNWNWFAQYHNASKIVGNAGGNGQECAMTIATNSVSDPSNPRIQVHMKGGPTDGLGDGSKIVYRLYTSPNQIVYDHFYKILLHTNWSKDGSKGFHELYIDDMATPIGKWAMPTLIYIPNGPDDVPNVEISNYRWMGQAGGVNWSSTILFHKVRIATDKATALA